MQNIVFQGQNDHIYQSVSGSGQSWNTADITTAIGLPAAAPGATVQSFVQSGVIEIVFITTAQHVYRATYSGAAGWAQADLTALASLPMAASGSALTYFNNGAENHVFQATNQHIWSAVSNGSQWSGVDIAGSGTPRPAMGTALASFVQGTTVSVSFLDVNQHLWQAVSGNGQSWGYGDITAAANAPVAVDGSADVTYLDGAQNFVFVGTNQHIYQAVYNGHWATGDISAVGCPLAEPGTPLVAYAVGNVIGFIYIATNQHLYEAFYISGGWSFTDLTSSGGAPLAAPGSPLSFYIDSSGWQHFVFEDTGQNIQQIIFSGSWAMQNVTSVGAAPPVLPTGTLKEYVYMNGKAVAIETNY